MLLKLKTAHRFMTNKFKNKAPVLNSLTLALMGITLLGVSGISNANNFFHEHDKPPKQNSLTANNLTFNKTSSTNLFGSSTRFPYRSEASGLSLPDLGSGGGRFDELNQHKALGEWSIQQLHKSAPLLNDPWSQEQLENMAWRINAQARTQAPLALILVKNPSINAFAIPGGVMGLHAGTVIESNSMDELASVIAHEVAHLSQRHYEHRADASTKAMLMQIGGLLAAIAASAADGDAAAAIMMGSQTAALNSQMAFSRSNEREADRIGMQLMAKSGYDPRAMPRFFSTLNQKTQLNMSKKAYLPSFIMTHPLSSERLSDAQSRANSYAQNTIAKENNPLTFDLLKWRLKLLSKQVNEGEMLAASSRSRGASLALAHWYAEQGQYQSAAKIINKLKNIPSPKSYSEQVAFDVLMAITEADISGMQNRWHDAEQHIEPYYNLYPERRDVKLAQAKVWLQLGKTNQVIKAIKPLVQNRPHDLEALFVMQRAYELMAENPTKNSNNNSQNKIGLSTIATANALRYRAKGELWRGKYDAALVSLQQAKTLLTNSKNNFSGIFNTKPLLASIAGEMAEVKVAKNFKP